MLTTFACPTCAQEIEADATLCGAFAVCPGCEDDVLVPMMKIGPGVTMGGFLLKELLGKGGMGEVYRATQLSMDREVALKILPPGMTTDREAVERFLKEARMSAKLDHSNIVTVHDAGEDNGYYFYAMSCVDGESLEEILTRDGPLAEKEALRIVRKVADALAFAWDRHRMLHRDIKPANVMIDADGSPKVLDLGLAKTDLEDQALTMTGMILGTPYYMSPEQARGSSDLDCRSDIYSLGATLYHLLCGSRPFESGSVMAVLARLATEEPPPLRSLRSDVSTNCELLVEVMMAKDVANRYESYELLIKDLRRVQDGKRPLGAHGNGVGLPGAAKPKPKMRRQAAAAPVVGTGSKAGSSKAKWIVMGVAAAAVVLVGAIALGGKGRDRRGPTSKPSTVAGADETGQTKKPGTTTVATKPPKDKSSKPPNKPRNGPAVAGEPSGETTRQARLAEGRKQFEAAIAAGDRQAAQAVLREYQDEMTKEQRRDAIRQFARLNTDVDGRRGRPGLRPRDGAPEPGGDNDDWNDLTGEATAKEPGTGAAGEAWDDLTGEPATGGAAGATKSTLGDVMAAVREELLDLNLPAGRQILESNKQLTVDQPELAGDFAVAANATRMTEFILASFRDARGQEAAVELRSGEKVVFVAEQTEGEAVVGKRIVRSGQTSGRIGMRIEMDELSLVERLKRLPPESDSAGAIMRGLEALSAGRPDAAERLFGASKSALGEALLVGLRERLAVAAAAAAARTAAQASRQRTNDRRQWQGAKPVLQASEASVARLAAGSEAARDQQVAFSRQHKLPLEIVDEVGIAYRLVPPGSFVREDGVVVRITKAFYMGKYEVTQEQYEAVMGGRMPASERGDRLPVDRLSWNHATQFANEVCRKLGVDGGVVRLPTEAEWEYAARAGTSGVAYYDQKHGKISDFANFLDASAPDKHGNFPAALFKDREQNDGASTLEKVGEYRPNAYGLYDVYGNVFEWCSDWAGPYQGQGEVADPQGPAFGFFKIHRGGSFLYREDYCNSQKRHQSPAKKYHGGQLAFGNALGVRLVREIE